MPGEWAGLGLGFTATVHSAPTCGAHAHAWGHGWEVSLQIIKCEPLCLGHLAATRCMVVPPATVADEVEGAQLASVVFGLRTAWWRPYVHSEGVTCNSEREPTPVVTTGVHLKEGCACPALLDYHQPYCI